MEQDFDDLVGYLSQSADLEPALARRVIGDVLAHFDESLESFVTRRHAQLAASGMKNEAIYARLVAEVGARRFSLPALSPRQIRRIIYG